MANGATLTLTKDGYRTLHEGLSCFATAQAEARNNAASRPSDSFVFDRLARRNMGRRPS